MVSGSMRWPACPPWAVMGWTMRRVSSWMIQPMGVSSRSRVRMSLMASCMRAVMPRRVSGLMGVPSCAR